LQQHRTPLLTSPLARRLLVTLTAPQVWVFSVLLIPSFCLFSLLQGRTGPLLAVAGWRILRTMRPARTWPALRAWFRLDTTPYWMTGKTVFDGFEKLSEEGSLLAFHPHGMLCCGWTTCNANVKFAPVTWLVADALLALPFISDFLRWNKSESVGTANMKRLLTRRRTVALLPGGFEEATLYVYGKHRVFLKRRMGFIKYALQHGYRVHPVYCFGEERTFYAFRWLTRLRLWLCSFRLPAVLFCGRLPWFFMPRRDVPIFSVVGPPIQLPRIEAPSAEEVTRWHGVYCQALLSLFDKHKGACAAEGEAARLEIL
jgi:1-acyl-sn-glycerol-3-phosphate acyltransferase